MFRHFSTNESVWFTSLICRSPLFTLFICTLLAFYLRLWKFSMITFASWPWCLSYSISYLSTCLFIFIHHLSIILFVLFNVRQRFWSASISHSLFNQWCVNTFFLHHLFKLLHRFIFLFGCTMSFQSVLFSKSMLLFLNLIEGLFNLLINFGSKLIFNFHSLHLK